MKGPSCKQCGARPAKHYEVTVRLKDAACMYMIIVCLDCARILDAMLDSASIGYQHELTRDGKPVRFLTYG